MNQFRAKRVDNNQWVFGDRVQGASGKMYIFDYDDINHTDLGIYEVIPETVGQFTGLNDNIGVNIFEGDILKRVINFIFEEGDDENPNIFYDKVVFNGGGFKTIRIDDENRGYSHLGNFIGHTIEVIGNIHESEVSNG